MSLQQLQQGNSHAGNVYEPYVPLILARVILTYRARQVDMSGVAVQMHALLYLEAQGTQQVGHLKL